MTSPSHQRPAADDSSDGLAMFVTFSAAVLIVTGTIGLLAVHPTWWMLVIALGVHAVGTIIVYVLVLLVLSDEPANTSSAKPSALGRARWVWSRMSHHQWTPRRPGVDAHPGAPGGS